MGRPERVTARTHSVRALLAQSLPSELEAGGGWRRLHGLMLTLIVDAEPNPENHSGQNVSDGLCGKYEYALLFLWHRAE